MCKFAQPCSRPSKARNRQEKRQQAEEVAFQKRQAHMQARAAARAARASADSSVDDLIQQLADTPVDDFSASVHHPILSRTTYLMCDIWSNRDWKGEIESFLVSIREDRQQNMECGVEDYYLAVRVAFAQTERMRSMSKWIGDMRRGPENSSGGAPEWTEVCRKLERLLRVFDTEQAVALNMLRKNLKEPGS